VSNALIVPPLLKPGELAAASIDAESFGNNLSSLDEGDDDTSDLRADRVPTTALAVRRGARAEDDDNDITADVLVLVLVLVLGFTGVHSEGDEEAEAEGTLLL
jgi:hypothetical protein